MIIDLGPEFQEASGPSLSAQLNIVEQIPPPKLRVPIETLIVDIWTPLNAQRHEATGLVWRDEHRRVFSALFERWGFERNVVILAGERAVWDTRSMIVARKPYAPPSLVGQCDVILHHGSPDDDYIIPPLWALCERHRYNQQGAGLLCEWDALTVLGGKPLPNRGGE